MNYPKVGIVIPNYNGAKYLQELLTSIKLKTMYPNYEIVVVDNGSTDNSIEVVKKFPGVELIRNKKNLGYPIACNQGARFLLKRGARYIIFLNNDTKILTQCWLMEMVKTATRHKSIGVVGCRVVNLIPKYEIIPLPLAGPPTLTLLLERFYYMPRFRKNKEKMKELIVGCVPGPIYMLSRDLIEKIGLLDEDFSPGSSEEVEYFVRARKNGFYIAYNPNVVVLHVGGRTMSKFSRIKVKYIYLRNKFLFTIKHYSIITLLFEVSLNIILFLFEARDKTKPFSFKNMKISSSFLEDLQLLFYALRGAITRRRKL